MKKLFLGSFATLLAAGTAGAVAQSAQPAPTVHYAFISKQIAFYRQDRAENLLTGPWQNAAVAPANWLTTAGGKFFLARGYNASANLEIWLDRGQYTGRINQIQNPGAATQTTLIHGTDESTITGSTTGMAPEWPWGEGHADYALLVGGGPMGWNGASGEWILDEGNYIGGGTVGAGHPALDIWIAGVGGGNAAVGGALMHNIKGLSATGTSFYASSVSGSQSGAPNNFGGNGLGIEIASGDVALIGTNGINESFGGDSGGLTYSGAYGLSLYADGGEGAALNSVGGNITINDYDFRGGGNSNSEIIRNVSISGINSQQNSIYVDGGTALSILGGKSNVNLVNGKFTAGNAGSANVIGPDSNINTFGGTGVYIEGKKDISITVNGNDQGIFSGGRGGSAKLTTRNELYLDPYTTIIKEGGGRVWANGGSGVCAKNNDSLVVAGITATGNNAGSATVSGSNSTANASGGHGLLAINTDTTIHSGTFVGGNGATATATDFNNEAEAYAGVGVMVSGGNLTINGGTFTGGAGGIANGETMQGNIGVWVQNGALTVDQTSTNTETLINGDLLFDGSDLDILGGTITGDIYKLGTGTTVMETSSSASFGGSFIQEGGTVNVNLSNPADAAFFSDVLVKEGTFAFKGQDTITAEGSAFSLANGTLLSAEQALTLSNGTTVNAGYGEVSTGGTLIMNKNSSLTLSYDALSAVQGTVNLGANDFIMDPTAQLSINGYAATTNGSVQLLNTTGTTTFDEGQIHTDLGWLVSTTVTNTGGVQVNWSYNSLTNAASLAGISITTLTNLDTLVTSGSTTNFLAWNSRGEANASQTIIYSASQSPDTSEAAFEVSRQLNQQIAARGSEFRSMNGFASTQTDHTPTGAAGPEETKSLQGWVRAYGSMGNHDKTSSFAEYDSSSYGMVVGVDKSFGNLLIGLAGGYANSDLDGGSTYNADINTYHGSIYSTMGSESIFVDLALTYGLSEVKEQSALSTGKFDSDMVSAYAGAGKSFNMGNKLAFTPEASFLATFYTQEEFDRTGTIPGTLEEYETESYLSSFGASLSTQHQLDWLSKGFAVIPEIRAHWLHEFNADPSEIFIAGTPYAVRPRDEDLFKLGFGFDMWHWKRENTKIEIDYDGLFSDTYAEHIFSGKLTVQF